ncbi:flagellar export chaperone FlgN [Roseovarius indicus]|uniref:flagellar export chaperone FlgN n=1 Tax=Roseovarius indicus TaxID=540747 RepID=UPI0007DA18D9|nr:flagellar export chaperone FlgN [Roseovarius indicus]OAO06111.1 hypothetical protein A8B76_04060 [Roseovarius indicus]
MEPETAKEILQALDDLLEHERSALLTGDLDQMAVLLDRKTVLIDALNAVEPEHQPDLDEIRGKVRRNQTLLDGALQGIRQVAGRMAALRQLRHSFDTYDESGRRHTIEGAVTRQVEKRA